MNHKQIEEIRELLRIAWRGARKLQTMYVRGECSPRSEIDELIGAQDRYREVLVRTTADEPGPAPDSPRGEPVAVVFPMPIPDGIDIACGPDWVEFRCGRCEAVVRNEPLRHCGDPGCPILKGESYGQTTA